MQAYSLYQLNKLIKESLRKVIPTTVWIRAEIHNIIVNYSGHCYIDLIEKSEHNDQIIAKQRATIWSSTYRMLGQKFYSATGGLLQAGMNILVEVAVEFHELYGISLNVRDIDPSYTLGELQRQRFLIIQRLKKQGFIDRNKSLPMPRLIKRIAIISSPTAAGYSDFIHQLNNNSHGFTYQTTLFPAVMQGPQTEESIISALDIVETQVASQKNNSSLLIPHSSFDIVVIIRGGGATSDLQAFDSEQLAQRCAMFPLPIITGIGHLRDETVLDLVAYSNLKTPTAVAEYIISRTLELDMELLSLADRLQRSVTLRLEHEKNLLTTLSAYIPQYAVRLIAASDNKLVSLQHRIELKTADFIAKNRTLLDRYDEQIKLFVPNLLKNKQMQLDMIQTKLQLLDPQQLLRKGYSFTTHNGKLVTSATQLSPGDTITTTLADGTVDSVVK